MTAGYSGTPLAQKLSLKPGLRTWSCGMPDSVRAEIERDGPALTRLDTPEPPIEAAHIFVTERAVLECRLRLLLPLPPAMALSGSVGPRRRPRSRPTSPRT